MSYFVKSGTFAISQPITARWRFTDDSRTAYQQADLTSMKYDARQTSPYTATLLADDTALVVADTISDTLHANNWSASTGGAGGASVPGTGDVAIFDGAATGGGGDGSDNCTLSASVTLGGISQTAGYTGTIDAATYDVTGDDGADFIFDGTGLDLGSGTLSITNGTFDYRDVGTFTPGTALVTTLGTCSLSFKNSNPLYDLTIGSGTTSILSTSGFGCYVSHDLILNGTFDIEATKYFQMRISSGVLTIGAAGVLTGNGIFGVILGSPTFTNAGTVNVADFRYYNQPLATTTFPAASYGGTVKIVTDTTASSGARFAAGSFTFTNLEVEAAGTQIVNVDCSTNAVTGVTITGDLTLDINSTGDITIDNSGQSPVWTIQGNVIDERSSTGDLLITTGNATYEWQFTGTNDQAVAWPDNTVLGKVQVSKTAGTLTLGNGMTCSAYTQVANSDIAGAYTITVSAGGNVDINGTAGNECIVNGPDFTVSGGGTIDADYTTITNSVCSGATGDATDNCTDGTGNTDWNFGGVFWIWARQQHAQMIGGGI